MDLDDSISEDILREHLAGIEYHIKQGLLSRKDLERLSRLAVHKLNETLSEQSNKEYLNLEQGTRAYSKILDTGITAQEALEYVAEYYGKDSDWVESVKNNNYLHSKTVVSKHKDHPVQKAMLKDGTLRVKALKHSKTPNHQLRELHSQRKLHTTLNKLKDQDNKLSDRLEELEAQSVVADTNIDKVMDTMGIERLTNKEKASKLKSKGITQKKIAEYLDIPVRTIKSWWNNI